MSKRREIVERHNNNLSNLWGNDSKDAEELLKDHRAIVGANESYLNALAIYELVDKGEVDFETLYRVLITFHGNQLISRDFLDYLNRLGIRGIADALATVYNE